MRGLLSLLPRRANALQRADDAVVGPVSVFESETLSVFHETTPYSEHAILHGVALMIFVVLGLASVVKLDRVVSAPGRVVPTAGSLFVQPLDRSIIREIKVSAGDLVKKGQILATLDPTFAAADLAQFQQKVARSRALVARLEAERAGSAFDAGANPDRNTQSQALIWQQRQREFQQGIADFDARIRSTEAKIALAKDDVANYEKRRGLADKIETMDLTLEQHGSGSKLNTFLSTSNRIDFDRLLAESQGQLNQSLHDIDALEAQRQVFIVKWQEDIGNQLVVARGDLDEANQGLSKAERVSQLINLTAPEDSVVLQIGKASVGSVVDASGSDAQPLFTLVPIDGALEADVEIDTSDIGFIKVGDPAEIKLDAYPYMRHGTAHGEIKTISEGSFVQGENQEVRSPYFKARVVMDDVHLRDVPASFRLIPGMTLAADIMIGKRSIMSYLVDGALRTGSEAMREP